MLILLNIFYLFTEGLTEFYFFLQPSIFEFFIKHIAHLFHLILLVRFFFFFSFLFLFIYLFVISFVVYSFVSLFCLTSCVWFHGLGEMTTFSKLMQWSYVWGPLCRLCILGGFCGLTEAVDVHVNYAFEQLLLQRE